MRCTAPVRGGTVDCLVLPFEVFELRREDTVGEIFRIHPKEERFEICHYEYPFQNLASPE